MNRRIKKKREKQLNSLIKFSKLLSKFYPTAVVQDLIYECQNGVVYKK